MKRQNVLNKKKRKKGFTLIELIIVMAILVVLAVIAVPKYTKYIDKANESSDMASGKTIANAAQTVYIDEQKAFTGLIDASNTDTYGDKVEGLLQNIPKGKQTGYKDSTFKVVVDADGKVEVYLVALAAGGADKKVYPE